MPLDWQCALYGSSDSLTNWGQISVSKLAGIIWSFPFPILSSLRNPALRDDSRKIHVNFRALRPVRFMELYGELGILADNGRPPAWYDDLGCQTVRPFGGGLPPPVMRAGPPSVFGAIGIRVYAPASTGAGPCAGGPGVGSVPVAGCGKNMF